MKKYIVLGILSATFSLSLGSYASVGKIGGGNTCTPRPLTCPDGSTVITSFCGSDQDAVPHACPHATGQK